MKGVALIKQGDVRVIEIEKPKVVSPWGAILKPIIVAPCTSDVHTIWHGSPKKENLILGHECVARVIEVGEKVMDYKPGDVVAVPAITPDWRKEDIQDGNFGHAGLPFSGHQLGRSINGVFEELFYIPDADVTLAKIPNNVTLEQALMSVDVCTTGFTAVDNADVQFGDRVLIIGTGAIGLMAIVGARLKGASKIVATGSRPLACSLAKKYGANEVVDYHSFEFEKRLLEANDNLKFDKVIICGGNDSSLILAYNIVKYGTGIISNVTYFPGNDNLIIPKFSAGKGMCGKTLIMSLAKGGRRRIERILDLISNGRFDPTDLITTKLKGFDNIIPGIYLMKDNKADNLKVAVYIDE